MRRLMIIIVGAIVVTALLISGQNFTYIGSGKCQMCHKTDKLGRQFPIWQNSKHATSSAALTSPEAAQAAKSMGVSSPAEDPTCLKCHAPLYEKAPELKAEGVTCEVCHSPGSEYRKLNIMKDKNEAIKNGLTAYADTEAIKTQCLTCHGNAHGQSFDFASAWEKIKHTIPEQK